METDCFDNFEFSPTSIEIYSKEYQQYIVVDQETIPPSTELHSIMISEKLDLRDWIRVALLYYNLNRYKEFLSILKSSEEVEFRDYEKKSSHELAKFDRLAGYYMNMALENREITGCSEQGTKSNWSFPSTFLKKGDEIGLLDPYHVVLRSILAMKSAPKAVHEMSELAHVTRVYPKAGLVYLTLGVFHHSLKEFDMALSMYRQGFQYTPFLCGLDVRLRIGCCYVRLGDLKRACDVFNQLIRLDGTCSRAHTALGIVSRIRQTNQDLAIDHFKSAYRVDPTSAIPLLNLSEYFYLTDQTSDSLAIATASILYTRTKRYRAEAYFLAARAQHELGLFDEAYENYRLAYQLGGDTFLNALSGLGQMCIRRNEINLAIKYFGIILDSEPRCLDTQRLLGLIYAHFGHTGKTELARKLLQNAIKGFPDDVEMLSMLHELEKNNKKLALEYIEKAIAVLIKTGDEKRITADLLNNLAVAEFDNGKFEEASISFSKALKTCLASETDSPARNARMVQFAYGFARCMEASQNEEDASHIYKLIYSTCPLYTNAILRLAAIAQMRGRRSETTEYLKTALNNDPENKDVWIMLGMMHMESNELGPAQKRFEKVLSLASDKTGQMDTYAGLAMANIWLNSLNAPNPNPNQVERHACRALEIYRKVLRDNPRCIIAVNGVACVLAHRGQLNGARFLFGLVKHNKPDYRDCYMNMANYFYTDKRYEMALSNYTAIEKLFPREVNSKLFVAIARTHTKECHYHEAEIALKRGILRFPHDRTLIICLASTWLLSGSNMLRKKKHSSSYIQEAIEKLKSAKLVFETVIKNKRSLHSNDVREQAARRLKRCDEALMGSDKILNKARDFEQVEKERLKKKYETFSQQALERREEKREQERMERETKEEQEKARQLITEQMAKRWAQMALARRTNEEQKKKRGSLKKRKKQTDTGSPTQDEEIPDSKKRKKTKRSTKKELTSGETGDHDEHRQDSAPGKVYKSKAFISSDEDSTNSANEIEDLPPDPEPIPQKPTSPPPNERPHRPVIISDEESSENSRDNIERTGVTPTNSPKPSDEV